MSSGPKFPLSRQDLQALKEVNETLVQRFLLEKVSEISNTIYDEAKTGATRYIATPFVGMYASLSFTTKGKYYLDQIAQGLKERFPDTTFEIGDSTITIDWS